MNLKYKSCMEFGTSFILLEIASLFDEYTPKKANHIDWYPRCLLKMGGYLPDIK